MSFSNLPGDHPVQAELQSLLQQLGWSYVALWSFNPQLRSLEWTGGHLRGSSTAQTSHEIWKQQFFNFTHKASVFTPGQGSVGMAYAEQRNMWVNEPSVYCSAGSEQEAQFLQQARIQTAVYVPLDKSVLELGTSENVPEDVDLMSSIAGFMQNSILPLLGHAVSQPPQSSHVPVLRGPIRRHNSEPTRRMSSSNIFLQELEEDDGVEEMRSRLASTSQQAVDIPETTQGFSNRAAFPRLQYRSHSGTTSSSLSSFEESSVKNSPEQSVSLLASALPSSSARRETPVHSPELPLGDMSVGVQAFTHIVDEQEQWPHMFMDMSQETPGALPSDHERFAFTEWRRTLVMPPRLEGTTMNHCLMRRCFHFLRHIPIPQKPEAHTRSRAQNFDLPGPRLTSSSSPETVPDRDPFNQAGPSRGHRQPHGRGRIGTHSSESTEAAKLFHMMKERDRRNKQKENFASLRSLVPIISKNDKASILSDAIIYLNVLHTKIEKMEADMAELKSQHERLKTSRQELQERNKQLEDIVKGTGLNLPSS